MGKKDERKLPEPPFPEDHLGAFKSQVEGTEPAVQVPKTTKLSKGTPQKSKTPYLEESLDKTEPVQEPRFEPSLPKASPPLFIKINRYRDVVRNINELKSHSLQLRDTLDALGDMEKEIKRALEMISKSLDRFNVTLNQLDSKLVKLREDDEGEVEVPKHVESYVTDLNKKLDNIKRELEVIEK